MQESLSYWGILPIFRGPFLERIAHDQHRSTIHELGDYFSSFSPPSVSDPLKNWFDFFYTLLTEQYRCEYVYKNTLATKLYLTGRHSLQNSFLTDELRSGNSRADVVIVNGTSTVYEVKSKFDSLNRLEGQMNDYRKVFDRIYVVTTAEKTKAVFSKIDPVIGVIVLNEHGKLDEIKEAQSNKVNTEPATMFDCMRQAEYCSIIKHHFGFVPNVPNSKLYRESKKIFCCLAPEEAHDLMVEQIRLRGKRNPFIDLIDDAPFSLKHACLSFSKSRNMALRISEKLVEPLLA